MELTQQQEDVVYTASHHSRVTATAGSGKTTTMIMRIIYLLHLEGVEAEDILVLMFNRDVKEDFRRRLNEQCKAFGKSTPDVDTFHGKGYKIYLDLAKKQKVIPLYSMSHNTKFDWRQTLAKTALMRAKSKRGDKDRVGNSMADDFLQFMEIVKSDIIPVEEKFQQMGFSSQYEYYIDAYEFFELERIRKKKMHYEDQIKEPVMAMLSDESILKSQTNKYKHIIVDEYQDINGVQHELVKALAGDTAGVMVVGDADQCIYEWRGARPEFITHTFEDDFPGAETFRLGYTFRNGHSISLAANSCIRNNIERIPQYSYSWSGPQTPFTDIRTHAANPGDTTFTDIINDWTDRGLKLKHVVVLVRLWAMAADVEVDLLRKGIPYKMADASKSIINNPFTLAMIGYVKLARGTLKDETFEDFYIYADSMMRLTSMGLKYEDRVELFTAMHKAPSAIPTIMRKRALQCSPSAIKLRNRLNERADVWETVASGRFEGRSDDKVMKYVYDAYRVASHYETSSFKEETGENKKRFAERIINIAKTACDSGSDFVSLYNECLENFSKLDSSDEDIVEITTIHRAKGYEWPCVIMPGIQEGSLPYYKGGTPPQDVEGERRTFYVGITRAERELHIIHPVDESYTNAALTGSTNTERVVEGMTSRFLYEANIKVAMDIAKAIRDGSRVTYEYENGVVAQDYVQDLGFDVKIKSKLSKEDKKLYSMPKGWSVGDRILVKNLGEGQIEDITVEGDKTILHVNLGGSVMPLLLGGNLEFRKIEAA